MENKRDWYKERWNIVWEGMNILLAFQKEVIEQLVDGEAEFEELMAENFTELIIRFQSSVNPK